MDRRSSMSSSSIARAPSPPSSSASQRPGDVLWPTPCSPSQRPPVRSPATRRGSSAGPEPAPRDPRVRAESDPRGVCVELLVFSPTSHALADVGDVGHELDAAHPLPHLEPELGLKPEAYRRSVLHGQGSPVHLEGEDGLGVV